MLIRFFCAVDIEQQQYKVSHLRAFLAQQPCVCIFFAPMKTCPRNLAYLVEKKLALLGEFCLIKNILSGKRQHRLFSRVLNRLQSYKFIEVCGYWLLANFMLGQTLHDQMSILHCKIIINEVMDRKILVVTHLAATSQLSF